uniref:5'-AMP-activated protein kinase subunit beta-1 n=1 Tax=Branchiostoma floridae TaxID=7739 RepID=C3YKR5_BRAFL|eukprot:XP_002603122.1 hypothetical protein BRAFLDRAFT_63244 [Branchiostoma floridae]
MARAPLPSANGERTTVNWHDHQVTALKPDPPECPPVKLVWCGDISGEVGVMGSWDGWSKVWKLNRSEKGEYSVALKIPCGQHEYKFLVNNTWFHDETKPTVSNSFGTLNNLVNVVKLSNGQAKAGINGAHKKSIPDDIPNKTNKPLKPSEPTLPNKTANESLDGYKQKATTATTATTTTPQIQEICKLETAKLKESCKTKTTTVTSNNVTGPQIPQEIRKPEEVSFGDTGFGQHAKPTSNGPADSVQGKGEVSNKEPMLQTCPVPKTTASRASRPVVPPKPGNSTTATPSSAVNPDPLLTTKATSKDVCVVEPVQQKCPQSQTTAYRVPPAKSLPKAPTKATTTAPPQNARARPEVPPKRTADKTGRPEVGTVGGTRNPEAAPPTARNTFKQPPATKPKPTQKRVVTSQAASRTAAKTVDGKGPSSQSGQAETRSKRSRAKMADRTKECSPLTAERSSTAVKAGAEDSVPVTFVLSSKGRTSGDVVILGSWDDWSQARKLENKEDTLEACLDLPSGDYEYKFKMGKTWFCDTTKPVVPNVFGTLNNYIEVVKETDGGSATSFPETVQVTHLDPEILQQALAKVSEETQTSEVEIEKTDERSTAGGDDKNSTTFVEEQTPIQEDKVSEEKETSKDGVEKTDESTIAECVRISATCVEEKTIQENKVSEEKEAPEDKIETTDESGIAEKDDKISPTCSEEQTIQEDTEPTATVAPQQFVIQDSLMSICMTPDMPPPVISKQATHEDKDFSEETVSQGRKRDEPTVCVCRKPVPIPVRPVPQETTSNDVIESESEAITETASQDETAAEGSEDTSQKSNETAQQHEEVVKEEQPELTMETRVENFDQTAVSVVERLEEKDDIKTTAQETTQMVETITPDVEKESKERVTPDSVEKEEDNTVPEAIMIKDTTGKGVAFVEKEAKPDERAEDEETVSREGKTDEPVICICYKPTPVTLVLSPETTSEDAIEPKSVATTDTTSPDKTVGDIAEGTDKKPDETAQQQEVKVVEEQPESSVDEEDGKPVEQAADDNVQKVESVEVSMETPLRDEEVEIIDEKREEVVQDIKEKPDQKVSNEETPQNEATERPDLDVSDKSEEKTSSQTTHPDQAADEDVIDIVVQSVDETVVKAAPAAGETFEENIHTEVTLPDETIKTTVPCTVAAPEEIDETNVWPPQEITIQEAVTNLETAVITESPTQDKDDTAADFVAATDELAASEIQRRVTDSVQEVSPQIAEKVEDQDATATKKDEESSEIPQSEGTTHDTVLVTSEDVYEKGHSEISPTKEPVEVIVLDTVEKLDDTTQTETPPALPTGVADTAEKVTSKTAPTFEPTQKDAPDIAEEVKVITVKITKEPQTGKPFKAAALQSKTYAQAVKDSFPKVEKTVQENGDMSDVGETHKETPPKDKSVDETVPENVELPKEEVTEMLPSEKVEEKVSEKEELTKEEIHIDAPSEDIIIKTIVEPQSVEFGEEKVHTETPPPDKPVERVVSEKTEEPKMEIHTETPPEDKTPENTVQQQQVEVVEEEKEEQQVEVVEEEKEEVQVVVQEKVQTETLSPDKTVETKVSEKMEGLEEEVSIETPPEDKTVKETVKPQVSEVVEETIQTEAPDKPVDEKVSEKVEEAKEEIHTEAPPEDKIIMTTVQPQNVEVVKETIHTETPPPDKPVDEKVSEKVEVPKEEIHTETPPEDKTVETTVQTQRWRCQKIQFTQKLHRPKKQLR